MSRFLIAGTFDLLHVGHTNLLHRSIINQNDDYIIAVTTDDYTTEYKQIMLAENEEIRITNVKNYCMTNFPNNNFQFILSNGNWEKIYHKYKITHIIHGNDWPRETYIDHMNRKAIDELGIDVVLVPHTPGISSTMIRLNLLSNITKNDTCIDE